MVCNGATNKTPKRKRSITSIDLFYAFKYDLSNSSEIFSRIKRPTFMLILEHTTRWLHVIYCMCTCKPKIPDQTVTQVDASIWLAKQTGKCTKVIVKSHFNATACDVIQLDTSFQFPSPSLTHGLAQK